MYCQQCGKSIVPDARFCSNCGAAISNNVFVNMPQTRLTRPRFRRMIAGVCAGFALHFGWDLTLVRVLTVVFTLITSGVGLLVYIGAWILMPEAPYALAHTSSPTAGQAGQTAGQQGTTA